MDDYGIFIILTAIGYDYILTFSDEIEYIWNRPWTWVTMLFFLVRYFGLCTVIVGNLMGSLLLPGHVKVHFKGGMLVVFNAWAQMIFLGASELTMILRVWVLNRRSTFILVILLALYATEIIPYLIFCIVVSIQNKSKDVTVQAGTFDFSFCIAQNTSPIWSEMIGIVQIILGALMCLLVVFQFIKEALQMYKVANRFRFNRYMNLLVREGIIYFLTVMTFALIDILIISTGNVPRDEVWETVLAIIELIPPFTIIPRFILSLRRMYARDLQHTGSDIDTAFGFSSGSAGASEIMFAELEQNEGLQEGEEIQMEEGGTGRIAGSSGV